MQEIFTPDPAPTEYTRRERPTPRPDRFAFWAVVMAVVAMIAGVASDDAGASDGGIGTTATTSSGGGKYATWWQNTSRRNKRWARRTSECESGGDPRAIGGGGKYRGAFQFLRSTWRAAPRSPGGDPVKYSWRTQAVVAVALKKRDGRGHWPNCG